MKRDTVEVTVKQTETPFRPTGIILPNICSKQELYFSIPFLSLSQKQREIRLSEEQSGEIHTLLPLLQRKCSVKEPHV